MAGINNAALNDRLPQRFSVDSDTFDRSALGDIDPDRNFLNKFTSCSNTYYDETEFNNKFRNSGNLSLLHLNIRSVRSHFTEFLCYLDTLDIDFKIIGLSETSINETDINYNIPKYTYELNCRQRRRGVGGGVSLYIHSLLQYKTRPELQLCGEVNSVFVEILKNSLNAKKNVICGCIYRPPSMSLVTFNKLLSDMFGKILRENKYIYLIGDFNVNILHDVPGGLSTQEFKNIFSTNYCFPLINIPTRVTMNSASLIDNMYSNFPAQGNVCDSGVLKTSISDHYAIFCIANNAVVNKTCTQSTRRSFCDRNIANFNIALLNTSWDFIYDNADMQSLYTSFQRVIDRLINTHFKMESFTTNYKNRHPWLTGPLRSQIKAKNRMYTEAIASGSAELMDKYKKQKNEVLSLLKNTEIMYFSDQMEINKNDLNKTWKILRIILGKDRNPSAKNPTFNLDGKIISDRAAIANGFNNYFVSIGPKLASKISSNVNPISYVKSINNSIVIPNITCHEVYQVICSLKNSSAGWDDFPTFVLKKCSGSLLQPLTHLINCSLQTGIFPDELKLARVVLFLKQAIQHKCLTIDPSLF